MIAKMMCVKADLISTRLLSKDDKQDMLDGKLPIETLFLAVKIWRDTGMPNYTDGTGELYREPTRDYLHIPIQRPGVNGKS